MNIVRGNELPPVLQLLYGCRSDQRVAPTPNLQFARESAEINVGITYRRSSNRWFEVLYTVADHAAVNRVLLERAQEGDSNALHAVQSHAAQIVKTDGSIRVQMLAMDRGLGYLELDDLQT